MSNDPKLDFLKNLLNPFAPEPQKFTEKDLLVPPMEDEQEEVDSNLGKISNVVPEVTKQRLATTKIPDAVPGMDPKLQKEMSAAEEIEKELSDLANKTPGETETGMEFEEPPVSSKLDMYRDLLSKAQKDRRSGLLTSNMLLAGNQIAQGFARSRGGQIGAGEEAVRALQQQANIPLQEMSEQQKNELDSLNIMNESELNDPDSDISKFARQQAVGMATRFGMSPEAISGLEKMSAKQLERLGFRNFGSFLNKTPQQSDYETQQGEPLSYNPLTNAYTNILTGEVHTGPVRRKVISQFVDPNTGNIMLRDRTNVMSLGAQKPVEEKQEEKITRRDLNPKQKDLLDKTRKELEDDPKYKNSMEAVDGADNAMALLQAGKDSGQDLVRAIQTMLAKSSGQVGVLTEQDVAGFNGRADVMSRLQRLALTTVKGKLPEEDRKFLMNFAKTMQAAARRNLQESTEVKKQQLTDDLGVKPEQAAGLLNIPQRVLMPEEPKGASGLTPEQRRKRIQELKAKQGK